jgi:hypothetical protein
MSGFLYRINGGQVVSATSDPITVYDGASQEFATIDAPVSDMDLAAGLFCDGATVRLATQPEKDNWPTAESDDDLSARKRRDREATVSDHRIRALLEVMRVNLNQIRSDPQIDLPALTPDAMSQAFRNTIDGD